MQISFDGLYANNLQNVCNPFPYVIAKNYQNLTTESGSKQRFSLLREKSIKARFRTGKFFGKVGKCQQPQTIYF